MRWQFHKMISGAAVFAVTGSYFPTCMAIVGSIIPDLLEMGIVQHRTITHWPLPWIAFALVSYEACLHAPSIWTYLFSFICIGALLHLVEDCMSVTGIPIRSPHCPRRGVGLYVTGSMGEAVLAIFVTGLFLLIAWDRGFFANGHAMAEIAKVKSLTALFWR